MTLRKIIEKTLTESPEEIAAIDEIIKAKQAEIVGLQKQKAAIQKADQTAAKPAQAAPAPAAPAAAPAAGAPATGGQ